MRHRFGPATLAAIASACLVPAHAAADFTILDAEGLQRALAARASQVRVEILFDCTTRQCPSQVELQNIDGVATDVESPIVDGRAEFSLAHAGTWQLKLDSPTALEVRISEEPSGQVELS